MKIYKKSQDFTNDYFSYPYALSADVQYTLGMLAEKQLNTCVVVLDKNEKLQDFAEIVSLPADAQPETTQHNKAYTKQVYVLDNIGNGIISYTPTKNRHPQQTL